MCLFWSSWCEIERVFCHFTRVFVYLQLFPVVLSELGAGKTKGCGHGYQHGHLDMYLSPGMNPSVLRDTMSSHAHILPHPQPEPLAR